MPGLWKKLGDTQATLQIAGETFRGVFLRQWNHRSEQWTVTFTALSDKGVALWGVRDANVPSLPEMEGKTR